MRNTISKLMICAVALALGACGAKVPADAIAVDEAPAIYPDYADVTVPVNIAPLNFRIETPGEGFVAHVHTRGADGFVVKGATVDMPLDKWHTLLGDAAGDSVCIDVYVKNDGRWLRYRPVKLAVAEEIDPYISYRLIEPSYVNFEVMRIRQRSLTDFDESDIYNNCPYAGESDGQCINCHAYQDYNRQGNWQMHVRIYNGGTLIANGDRVTKVNLKLPQTISAGVYPAWHPTLPLIAYSNNNTSQIFHYSDHNKIEVQDSESDLILYDVDKGQIRHIANDSLAWETFPAWSPDGKYLYYVSANITPEALSGGLKYRERSYRDIKYDIYRRAFDPATMTFGAADTVYRASAAGRSATLPRISPDGRYLLFTEGEYGTFHIWHHDADLFAMDLDNDSIMPLSAANSPDTESYHSWSSNGRWILFSSRRDDGAYTRLYITYFDKDGKAHKPFMLPQRDPESNIMLYKSYNVPEFMVAPVTVPRGNIINALREPAAESTYIEQR